MRSGIVILASAALLALGACGSGDGESAASSCDPGARKVRIQALDTPSFQPSSVNVQAGEPVCFVVTNEGQTEHEFVVGDRAMQEKHEQEMASGEGMQSGEMDMGGMPELTLAAGETKSVTTTFDEPGTMMYACHEPGHYAAGMVGTITITSA